MLLEYKGKETEVVIPNGVKEIGGTVFRDRKDIVGIVMPNSVTGIADHAFSGCTGLTSIVIPNSVKSIGESAFFGCTGLTSIVIPNSVKSIGARAFRDCAGFTSIEIANSVSIGKSAFEGCTKLVKVVAPKGFYREPNYDRTQFNNCPNLSLESLETIKRASETADAEIARVAKAKADAERARAAEANAANSSTRNNSGGCYIATAVYGSYDCPEVRTLRRYRDFRLEKTAAGRAFIKIYYAIAPWCVKHFGKCAWFNALFRRILDKKVKKLNAEGVSFEPYQDK